MKLSELQARQGNVEVQVEIMKKGDIRTFSKFGKEGRVCNATIKDASGEIQLSLWNEQIDQVNVGDKVKVTNGYVNEWQGEKQLSTGKFGKLEVVEKAARLSDVDSSSGVSDSSSGSSAPSKPSFKEAKLDDDFEAKETEIQEEDFEEEV